MTQKETLSIFGLGKLGSTMLSCFAYKGWKVIGVDVVQENVDAINDGKSPIFEPRVGELINDNKELIEATTDVEYAVLNSHASFVMVPTPSEESGLFSTKFVEAVCKDIAQVLKIKKDYHVIIITSTVLMGDTERVGKMVEDISGKKIGEDFGLVYNPEFIALGRIVMDFLNPDMVLVGESDERAGSFVESLHKRLTDNDADVYRMNSYNAELAKISLNSFCTLKITFANTIAEICENLPGGDSEKVLKAIGSDSRIGTKYFRGGLGFGGVCFPRDNRALFYSAKNFGVDMLFSKRTDDINDYHKTARICELITNIMAEKETDDLAILGLAYKEDTPIVEESPAMEVVKLLSWNGIRITVFDPAAMEEAKKELGEQGDQDNVVFADTALSCLKDQSVCFIATPWDQFTELEANDIIEAMNDNPIILDAWGILPFERVTSGNNKKSVLSVRRIGKNYK